MKKVGYALTIIAVLVIAYNVWYVPRENRKTLNDHPIVTLLARGENLERTYPFMPPFTRFELSILALGVGGVALIIVGSVRDKRSRK